MSTEQNYRKALVILTALFFMWGFITVMNDILVNTFQSIFDLTPTKRALVQRAFFGAFFIVSLTYFIISSVTGKDPVNKIGYKNGMIVSLLICGFGCMCFYPAAQMSSYSAFLAALFILATGVTLLQICANPYVAIIGNQESASGRLNLAQGFNSLGTTLGPLIGVILIYQVFSDGQQTADSVGRTYLIYGAVFLLFGVFVFFTKMPSFVNNEKIEKGISVLKNRHLRLGIIAIFFYVGSEVSVGTWLVEFLKSDNVAGLSEESASYFLSYFWGGLMIGRLMAGASGKSSALGTRKLLVTAAISIGVFAFIYLVTSLKYVDGSFQLELLSLASLKIFFICLLVNYIAFLFGKGNAARSLMIFSILNFVLLLTAMLSTGTLSMWAIIGTGLFFSIGWSNVFTLAIKNLGQLTSQGSSLLVMAIVGGAVLPGIQSKIIEAYDIQTSFIVPLAGMLYLIYYGWQGHKVKHIEKPI